MALRNIGNAGEAPFKFGLTPVFLSNDLELLSHMRSYLASRLAGAVELVSRRTYHGTTGFGTNPRGI
ncbi:hypothetical protein [Mesorhizobium sp. YR577]|uniref:hypothetical protein n=1 Tax=Mesorhizobium sp. YR577 TaxID=1884373 RepID=UPI0008E1A289|nr:hypothetical protein [Mesorhizobium sp. YR577]SFU23289.1 hypothetical protein SAMN05518861_15412 [Mesorhizobium sp. YR577]